MQFATVTRVGEIVRAERERQQLTQSELALAAGVSYRTVLQIEKGKPTSRVDVLVRVLEALGLTLDVRAAPRSLSRTASEPLAFFEIVRTGDDAYAWRLNAANGEILADSPLDYESRAAALTAVRQFISVAGADQRLLRNVEIFSRRRVYHWRLKASNGALIATSDRDFSSRRAAQQAARHALLSIATAEVR